ncbi:toprim domain-containing protein [Thioalkalivibrio sp. ALJ16]|uniref:toprim domain-containing protein n=1 Tax=Thioalkalivibrio sp. ALJ16 TaxID=1158762 RepID=UPI00036916DC|nr:toprim domain-containing protein [Thioalkalivibrio sp. ALJ16]
MIGTRKSPGARGAAHGAGGIGWHRYGDYSSTDPLQEILAAMARDGVAPYNPEDLRADGSLVRYRVDGDKAGTRNGWCVLHLDGIPAAAYGSWKHGVSATWCARSRGDLTPADREALRQRMDDARRQRDEETQQRHERAADRARQQWRAADPADPNHPYLVNKRVGPHHARQRGDRLVLPVIDPSDATITSLQTIGPDGDKLLLPGGRKRGCCIPVALGDGGPTLIAEGFATACTLAEADPAARVLAAIDAGNLEPVALAVRERWPDADIVVCADADDVGIAKARTAAAAAGARLAIPDFPPGAGGSDWNDLATLLAAGGGA